MIEAVNSVISNAVLARGSAEQQSVARSYAANPERVQEVARAPYVSPYISMDINYNKAVLQIRDSDTGDVVRQFPSESQMEAYRKAQAAQASREALSSIQISGPSTDATPAQKTTTAPSAPTPSEIATAAPSTQGSGKGDTAPTPVAIEA